MWVEVDRGGRATVYGVAVPNEQWLGSFASEESTPAVSEQRMNQMAFCFPLLFLLGCFDVPPQLSPYHAVLGLVGPEGGAVRGPGVAGVQFALCWSRDGPVFSASTVYML